MFDFLKNLTKSNEEKQQEAFSAYLDGTLSPSQRREFEALLTEDADLRADMELAQLVRQQMNEMPRRSLPRIFTLDLNVYGAPQKEPLVQAYPFLRAATVMTAVFFVIALGLSVYTMQSGGSMVSVAQTALEPAPAFDAPMAEAEIAMEEAAEEPAESEQVADEIMVEEEVLQEELMEEEKATEIPAAAPLPTLPIASTKSTGVGLGEGAAAEANNTVDGAAPVEESEDKPPSETVTDTVGEETVTPTATLSPTPLPTATVSSLPRLEATETAVPRIIEPPTTLPDEVANGVADKTAVAETYAVQESWQQPTWFLTTWQTLLLGLGFLLLILVAVTLLTRRKI